MCKITINTNQVAFCRCSCGNRKYNGATPRWLDFRYSPCQRSHSPPQAWPRGFACYCTLVECHPATPSAHLHKELSKNFTMEQSCFDLLIKSGLFYPVEYLSNICYLSGTHSSQSSTSYACH